MLSTMVMLVIYLHFKPLSDPRQHKIEIFNEMTMLILLYILVFYTDLTDQEFTFRNDLGLVSIFLTLFNFVVHIILLSVDSLIQAK